MTTNETKWTPGPWKVERGLHGYEACVRGETSGVEPVVADVPNPTNRIEDDTTAQANARLIAAAPDLYEALTAIVASIDALGMVRLPKMDAARAALAKATAEAAL